MAFADAQSSLTPADSCESANLYTRQLARHRRALLARREIEQLSHLARSAPEAAFASLMRNPRPANADSGAAAGSLPARPPTPPPAATAAFEQAVATALQHRRRLDFTQRMSLRRHAAGLGLSRFDANLLIARVEHYHAVTRSPSRGPTSLSTDSRPPARRSRLWVAAGLTILLVQGVMAWIWLRLFS